MILNIEATRKVIGEVQGTVSRVKELCGCVILACEHMRLETPEDHELVEKMRRVKTDLEQAWYPLYALDNRLSSLAKDESAKGNEELARLKREVEEKEQKIKDLFNLDEKNCELKRELKELRERLGVAPTEKKDDDF